MVRTILTEEPVEEIWSRLRRYCYPDSVRTLLRQRYQITPTDDQAQNVASAISQGIEYFRASATVGLQLSPLLLYYGMVNLLTGWSRFATAGAMQTKHHGLGLDTTAADKSHLLGDLSVSVKLSSTGALAAFLSMLQPAASIDPSEWSLAELLGAIPEVFEDTREIYPNRPPLLIPLEETEVDGRAVHRVSLSLLRDLGLESPMSRVPSDWRDLYVTPQQTTTHFVLRPRVKVGKSAPLASTVGALYLPLGRKTATSWIPPILILYLMSLYALGMASRYQSQIWFPFVQRDASGERWLMEKFIRAASRQVPHLILERLSEEEMQFAVPVIGKKPRGSR